jgi:DNA-binding HxlR family transcriptional regulator
MWHMGGARFVELRNILGISGESLRQTLTWMIRQGWIQRNPGYGHPLRPEYVLRPRGARIARAVGLDRFSLIRAALPRVTPRALAEALRRLEEADLVNRDVRDTYPPSVRYSPGRRARRELAGLVQTR